MAKTLIESSITIYGMGVAEAKTVFNIKSDAERTDPNFRPLTILIERKSQKIFFDYDYFGNKRHDSIAMDIPAAEEPVIKAAIISAINAKLSA